MLLTTAKADHVGGVSRAYAPWSGTWAAAAAGAARRWLWRRADLCRESRPSLLRPPTSPKSFIYPYAAAAALCFVYIVYVTSNSGGGGGDDDLDGDGGVGGGESAARWTPRLADGVWTGLGGRGQSWPASRYSSVPRLNLSAIVVASPPPQPSSRRSPFVLLSAGQRPASASSLWAASAVAAAVADSGSGRGGGDRGAGRIRVGPPVLGFVPARRSAFKPIKDVSPAGGVKDEALLLSVGDRRRQRLRRPQMPLYRVLDRRRWGGDSGRDGNLNDNGNGHGESRQYDGFVAHRAESLAFSRDRKVNGVVLPVGDTNVSSEAVARGLLPSPVQRYSASTAAMAEAAYGERHPAPPPLPPLAGVPRLENARITSGQPLASTRQFDATLAAVDRMHRGGDGNSLQRLASDNDEHNIHNNNNNNNNINNTSALTSGLETFSNGKNDGNRRVSSSPGIAAGLPNLSPFSGLLAAHADTASADRVERLISPGISGDALIDDESGGSSGGSGSSSQSLRTILLWNTFFGRRDYVPPFEQICPGYPCRVTSDRSVEPTADAIVVHLRDIQPNDAPRRRSADQLFVLLNAEAPPHSPALSDALNDLFNWTITYRRDADIPLVKDVVNLFQYRADESSAAAAAAEIGVGAPPGAGLAVPSAPLTRDYHANRTKMAVWFVSHCTTASERESLVAELARHGVHTDIVGECGSGALKCARNDLGCYERFSRDYLFYLSFENAICADYVTEKLYNVLERSELVPVVLGGADYTRAAPPGSYIDVGAFGSVRELALYMQRVSNDPRLYNSYHRWRNFYQISEPAHYACRLCAKLHTSYRRRMYQDFNTYWHKDACRGSWKKAYNLK